MPTSFVRALACLLLLALLAACGASAPADPAASSPHTYTIAYFLKPDLPRVSVSADIPGTWTEKLEFDGAPAFSVPGNSGFFPPSITALGIDLPDTAARMEKAMELQYGAGTPGVTRTVLDDGRIWAIRSEETIIHARMFIPAPHGVVMAVAFVKPTEAALLANIEEVYQTVRVQPDSTAQASPQP
jgi:hypothetical protein